MTQEPENKSNDDKLAEVGKLFGSPPILSCEDPKIYDEIMARLMRCIAPRDFVEQMLIKDLTDATWEMSRYMRFKSLAIEIKFRQIREFQANRAKAAAQRGGASTRPPAASHEPATELGRMHALEDKVDNSVRDVEAILMKPLAEFDHVRALEAAVAFHGRLDEWLNDAVARRNLVLTQLERYRDGLGQRLREASDEIIDAEFKETEPQPEQVSPPLVPLVEATQPSVAAAQPAVEGNQSLVDAGQLSVVAGQPALETTQPSVVADQPIVEVPQPSVEVSQPSAAAPQPSVEASQ